MSMPDKITVSPTEIKIAFENTSELLRCIDSDNRCLFDRVEKTNSDLSQETKNLLKSFYVTIDYNTNNLSARVATSHTSSSNDSIRPYSTHISYYEAEIMEQDVSKEDKKENNNFHQFLPESYYEISLPPLHKFKNPTEHSEFTSRISTDSFENVAYPLQESIEFAKWVKMKTSYVGSKTNLPTEWDPSYGENSKEEVRARAKQLYQTATNNWKSIFGVSYREWFVSINSKYHRNLDIEKVVLLDLVSDSTNESYCHNCGKIDNQTRIHQITNQLGRDKQVCYSCASQLKEFTSKSVRTSIPPKQLFNLKREI